MKYKKQISMICLITFLFLTFQKYEEPKAEILTLTTGTIIACAALATVAGVIITNPDMLEDVGTIVYDGIKNIPNAIENVGNNIKLNVTKDLLNTVVGICKALPTVEVVKNNVNAFFDGRVITKGSIELATALTVGSTSFELKALTVGQEEHKLYIQFGGETRVFTLENGTHSISWDMSKEKYCYVTIDDNISYSIYYNGIYPLSIGYRSNYKGYMEIQDFVYNESICIPYEPLNTENVSADKPKEYFPVGSGSISVPIDTPLSNYNPSVDNPISLPSDLVGDGISADVDTSTDTGAIDKPNVDVGETPTTGESLWDTLLSWLSSLFSPLFSLLSWIGDLLNSILDFLKSLVIPEEFNSLDFSPLYFSFANKFPFCIPFDLINMIKEFESEKKEPKFYVDMSAFSNNIAKTGDVGFEIDLTKFDELITIVRTISLISFIFYIAFKTRDIIKG